MSDTDSFVVDPVTITELSDLENSVWQLTELLHQVCDEVEAKEPLQAKQTMAQILAHTKAMEGFVNAQQD